MAKSKILIVEDEWIIANDIKSSLKDLGYNVVAVAATGNEAIEKAKSQTPDLILMDIVLQGDIDGIEASKQIMTYLDMPVVYLTAYTDDKRLKQAKKSGAYGYLIKPFKDRELQATIEMALYKHKMEKKLKQSESRLLTTLKSINDAVISTDKKGLVTFMNPLSQSLTGYKIKSAKGKHLQNIFNIKSEVPDFINTTLENIIQEGLTIEQAKYLLYGRDKPSINIELSFAPITDDKDKISGLVIIFRDITKRIAIESKLLDYQKQLQTLTSTLSLFEENEKRRIATELHDCVGQTLALSKIKLGLLNKSAPTPELKSSIKEILQLIEQTIKETRTLTFELSPPTLYELGLRHAVQWLIDQFREKHGIKVELENSGFDKPFDNNVRYFLFQAIRELLFNIIKHAQATKVKITLSGNNNNLCITVEDNGVGFAKPSVNHDGFGLFNIRERMNHINGTFEVDSKNGRGTRVTLVAPFKADKST
jgi:PAS domain S-box-containing protein